MSEFNMMAETPALLQLYSSDSNRENETFIDTIVVNIKIDNIKKDIIVTGSTANCWKTISNMTFKLKCEKLISKSYLNSKTYMEKLENEIENKDKIIKCLLVSLENFSNTSNKYTSSGHWTKFASYKCSKEREHHAKWND